MGASSATRGALGSASTRWLGLTLSAFKGREIWLIEVSNKPAQNFVGKLLHQSEVLQATNQSSHGALLCSCFASGVVVLHAHSLRQQIALARVATLAVKEPGDWQIQSCVSMSNQLQLLQKASCPAQIWVAPPTALLHNHQKESLVTWLPFTLCCCHASALSFQ